MVNYIRVHVIALHTQHSNKYRKS